MIQAPSCSDGDELQSSAGPCWCFHSYPLTRPYWRHLPEAASPVRWFSRQHFRVAGSSYIDNKLIMHTCKSIDLPPQNTRGVYHVREEVIIFSKELRKLERLLDPHLRFLDRLAPAAVHEIYGNKLATFPSFAITEEYSNAWATYVNTCIFKMKVMEWVHLITASWTCRMSAPLIGTFNLYSHRQRVPDFRESSMLRWREECRALTGRQVVLRDSQHKRWADLEPIYERPKGLLGDA